MNSVITQAIKASTLGAEDVISSAIYNGLARIAKAYRQGEDRRRVRRELERLYQDEHLLNDVGLTRGDLAGYGPSEAELASREIMRKNGM